MSQRTKKLIEEFKNFRTRSRAKGELISIGDEAVDELIAHLKERAPNTLWITIKTLEAIRNPRTVVPLLELLASGVEKTTVIDALQKITGESFGSNIELWRNWLKK